VATVAKAVQRIETFMDDAHVILWTPLTSTNVDGEAIEMTGSADRSVQVTGTFDSGSVAIQGSNVLAPVASTDADWFPLTDPLGNAIAITAAGGCAVMELTRWIRPKVSGAGGTASLSVRLLVKRK
jgi:hypothetical protein